jgi:hypothetical protein
MTNPAPTFHFREGFWTGVAWGAPDSPVHPLCSKCQGALPDVPLMLWIENGAMIQLCDDCIERWLIAS